MSIKDKYTVRSIKKEQTYEWLLKKHYAHRLPPISYAFGLFNHSLVGVCTFGNNGGNPEGNFINDYQIIELNRLCVAEDLEKNVLSFFVSQCLKVIPKKYIIVSYSDLDLNHHGYIYQATNWYYAGFSKGDVTLISDNETLHRKSFYDRYGRSDQSFIESKGFKIKKQKGKYRYFYFLDTKQKLNFPYKQEPYPKGDNKRYDASYKPSIQMELI